MCDTCWSLTARVTRGWFVLVQRLAVDAGWPERLQLEHDIIWDILVAQAQQSREPPAPRQVQDKRKVRINLSGVRTLQRRFRR